MALVLTDTQKVALSIAPVDAAGNPAAVEEVTWEVSDSAVLTLAVAEDGLSAEVVTTGALGTAQVSVKADALIGEGVEELTGLLDIEVVADKAVSLGVTAGTPESRL
jgi:hypothetical protein